MSHPQRRAPHQLGLWRWEQGNGLPDDWWIPVLVVDRRVVRALLEELSRAGIPAYCVRFRSGRLLFPAWWCLWVGGSAYERAEERLAEVLPLLNRPPRRGPATA